MRRSLYVCLVILIGLSFFSGCGKASQRAIIGEWERKLVGIEIVQIYTLKLFKDGTFARGTSYRSARQNRFLPTSSGTYEFIKKDKIRFNRDNGGSQVYKFEISKDRLFLTGIGENGLAGGSSERLQRVRY